ncbi:MAG: Fic family protein [Candidatus Omnitrophica bacterium]|nr:Fic family protein [Candidatus Omnitrophota bacterium]
MPFIVKYKITNKILNNISQITAGREVVEHSRLIPKWELNLRKDAAIHNAHSSTSIEGNRLSLEQVKALSEKKVVAASVKDKQEVINYLKALDNIPRYALKEIIDNKLFLRIHKTITKGTLKNDKDCGVFRNRQVFVGKRVFDGTHLKEVVEYMPPKTKDMPGLVDTFLSWLNSEKSAVINPVIVAGIVHFEVARIHPFIDGNGRTARLLASLILYKRGFDHRRFFALDDYYDEARENYYAALRTAQNSKRDLTKWLEYFTDGVLYSVHKLKSDIEKIGVLPKAGDLSQIQLSQRQLKILVKIKDMGQIGNKDLQKMFKISRQAVLKEMKKLITMKLIELIGKGRNAYYKLKD